MNEIEKCILDSCDDRWLKVVRIISEARERAGLTDNEESYDKVAQKLKGLVAAGKLEAIGNLENWRGSEVRLKG